MAGAVSSAGLYPDQSFAVSGLFSPDQPFAVTTARFSPDRMGMDVRSIITGIGSHRGATTGMRVIPMPIITTTIELA